MRPRASKVDPKGIKSRDKLSMVFVENQDYFLDPVRTYKYVAEKMDKTSYGPFYVTKYKTDQETKKRFRPAIQTFD